MSNQLSLQAVPAIPGSGENIAPSRNAAPAQTPAAKPVPLFVNPSFRFDPTVGLEVMEFHDDTGRMTNSIPSQRQLAAYRDHQATPPGEPAPKPPQTGDGTTSAG
jgi:hypothetical protein